MDILHSIKTMDVIRIEKEKKTVLSGIVHNMSVLLWEDYYITTVVHIKIMLLLNHHARTTKIILNRVKTS